ncbi:MAG: DUF1488 domain-containing protein [Pseudomonadota bacterium]
MVTIHFPLTEPICTPNTTVAFEAVVDGVMTSFEISEEALLDHFGADSRKAAELVRTFKANRPTIEAVAKIKLPIRLNAGRLLLVSTDF